MDALFWRETGQNIEQGYVPICLFDGKELHFHPALNIKLFNKKCQMKTKRYSLPTPLLFSLAWDQETTGDNFWKAF